MKNRLMSNFQIWLMKLSYVIKRSRAGISGAPLLHCTDTSIEIPFIIKHSSKADKYSWLGVWSWSLYLFLFLHIWKNKCCNSWSMVMNCMLNTPSVSKENLISPKSHSIGLFIVALWIAADSFKTTMEMQGFSPFEYKDFCECSYNWYCYYNILLCWQKHWCFHQNWMHLNAQISRS